MNQGRAAERLEELLDIHSRNEDVMQGISLILIFIIREGSYCILLPEDLPFLQYGIIVYEKVQELLSFQL